MSALINYSNDELTELCELLELEDQFRSYNKIHFLFADDRHLYPKHLQFFAAGSKYRQRLFLAGNRVGKSLTGLFETTLHATGNYPDWWQGRRFNRPVNIWLAGDTNQTVRDILQTKLLGPIDDMGSGLLPRDALHHTTNKAGIGKAIEMAYVRHSSGGMSTIGFKSYDQGRKSFQGTEKDLILMDEEPPYDVYVECLMRTMTNDGMLMLTFTPLLGLSEVVLAFLPGGQLSERNDDKFVVMATWNDCPHLSEEAKKELWDSIPPFQRDARSKGVPQLGAGAIYPVPESEIVVPDFKIPDHWPRSYGFDVGWQRTAAIWGAEDRESGVIYMYSEYYKGQAEPVIHAEAIKSRGVWVSGVIDPAARGRGQRDGEQLLQQYVDLGLHLQLAKNGVESGLYNVWQRLSSGRLKVFDSLTNFKTEYRLYRRNEKGQVVKENDHLMDALRYYIASGIDMGSVKPEVEQQEYIERSSGYWMG